MASSRPRASCGRANAGVLRSGSPPSLREASATKKQFHSRRRGQRGDSLVLAYGYGANPGSLRDLQAAQGMLAYRFPGRFLQQAIQRPHVSIWNCCTLEQSRNW